MQAIIYKINYKDILYKTGNIASIWKELEMDYTLVNHYVIHLCLTYICQTSLILYINYKQMGKKLKDIS